MTFRRLVVFICAVATACSAGSTSPFVTPDTGPTAQALNEAAANSCPWPANVGQFAQTSLIARHAGAAAPDLDLMQGVKSGCAVLAYSVDQSGIVSASRVLADVPVGFGNIAEKILRWNDYAIGTSDDTVFMVRIGAELLPNGAVLLSLAFKDNTIDIVVPKSAGR